MQKKTLNEIFIFVINMCFVSDELIQKTSIIDNVLLFILLIYVP